VLVSHDRAFLDSVTKRTIEISGGKIYDYKAGYSGYIKMREERLEQQTASYNNQQKQVREIERFVERFRYKSTKAKQVQSRIKMLDKMEEIELDDIDKSSIHFRFPPAPHSGKVVLEAINLGKKYGDLTVLKDVNFAVLNGDKLAFVGRNGEGKSTLAKIIVRELDFTGTLKYGHNVQIGYFAQNQGDYLDPDKTVFETIDDIATGDIRKRVRAILGAFLFSGETIDKKVKILSGGEKSRLSLAKLLLTPSNLLILDEPTNHLDMQSKDILKNALLQFDGTLIIVSHDRDFLQGLTDKLFEFRNNHIREHLGGIYEFLEARKLNTLKQLEKQMRFKNYKPEPKSSNKLNWERKKQLDRDIRKIKNEINKAEKKIEELEADVEKSHKILSDPTSYFDNPNYEIITKEYEKLKRNLENEMSRWEKFHLKLEELQKDK
jgi:ATP-binding cassette subfamily F protein 3